MVPSEEHAPQSAAPPQRDGELEVVLVPAHPVVSGEAVDVGFETRLLSSGQPALMAFTTLDKLVQALGDQQPWIAVPAARIVGAARTAGFPLVLDPIVDPGAPRWTNEGIQQLAAAQRSRRASHVEGQVAAAGATESTRVVVEIKSSDGSSQQALVWASDLAVFVEPAEGQGPARVMQWSAARLRLAEMLAPTPGALSAEQIGDETLRWLGGVEATLDLEAGEARAVGSMATLRAERNGVSRSVRIVHLVGGRSCVAGNSTGGASLLLLGRPDEAVTEALAYIGLED